MIWSICGVVLFAADEPIVLNGKRATTILTRRVKQGVPEWYVLELLHGTDPASIRGRAGTSADLHMAMSRTRSPIRCRRVVPNA
ncbi:MAG: hypothetical protein M3454_12795 [Actinomycetota bacterium]|nr:hypothetical protein [Actinomycetota bacterium]